MGLLARPSLPDQRRWRCGRCRGVGTIAAGALQAGLSRVPVADLGGKPTPQDSAEARRQPDDIADEELGDYGIPSGWKQCPAQGQPISRFIPSKVNS